MSNEFTVNKQSNDEVAMRTEEYTSLIPLPTLEQEDIGLAVTLLQHLLVSYGYLSSDQVNGVFAWTIDNAVRQFQHDNGLYADGVVGYNTWSALMELNDANQNYGFREHPSPSSTLRPIPCMPRQTGVLSLETEMPHWIEHLDDQI